MMDRARYARNGDINIAYVAMGTGPPDLVWVQGAATNVAVLLDDPDYRGFCERLAAFSPFILFDKRGMGLSERVEAGTMEDRMGRCASHHGRHQRHGGTEIDTAGDRFFASFDGPARAIRCAVALQRAIGGLDLRLRIGLHTGEVERSGNKLSGIVVHTGARVAALASPGEVLVSSTVRDLVAGSGIDFEDRGTHALKGVPGEWRIYAVTP